MKSANIPVCGNIAVYIKYYAVCLNIDYTLRCLEYTRFVTWFLIYYFKLIWRQMHFNQSLS